LGVEGEGEVDEVAEAVMAGLCGQKAELADGGHHELGGGGEM
jgi:hypothetical protein